MPSHRGRAIGREVLIERGSEDGTESYYDQTYPSSHYKDVKQVRVQFEHDTLRSPNRQERQYIYHHSPNRASAYHEPENIIINNSLNVPQHLRPRASSQGAVPHPNYLQPIFIPAQREPSRERIKHYSAHGAQWSSYSSESDSQRSSSKHRRRKRRSSSRDDRGSSTEIAKQLARLELLEEQRRQEEYERRHRPSSKYDPQSNVSALIAEELARLKLLEERRDKKEYISPDVAAKLAQLKAMEDAKAHEEAKANFYASIENDKRKEKYRDEQIMAEYREKQRRAKEEEDAAFAAAEAKRAKREAEAKTEHDRIVAMEKERAAKEKAERLRIIAEEKAKAEKEQKEAEEERQRILLEEEARKKKEKDKHEAMKKQFLAEEEERIKKEKQKAKKEEEEFNQKVKEKFMKAGYSPDYIEDILDEKRKALVRRTSRRSENLLAIEADRPTYIRVQVRHLMPETLDYYSLPWEYDPKDNAYLFIKEYVSHDLQQELFEHTRKIKVRREKLLITDGYTKETTTILKPRGVVKDDDNLYVVRRKSTRSKSPGPRRSWMFT